MRLLITLEIGIGDKVGVEKWALIRLVICAFFGIPLFLLEISFLQTGMLLIISLSQAQMINPGKA